MQCQICGENEASIHFKQVFDGTVKEMYVCSGCAEKNGMNVHAPAAMADFLLGVGVQRESSTAEDRHCPVCGIGDSEFHKRSRLGCPACYEAFSEELSPLLEAMHKGTRHVGKVPAGERVSAEIASLERALQEAVAGQDFEEAAKRRDMIKELKAGAVAQTGEQGERVAG